MQPTGGGAGIGSTGRVSGCGGHIPSNKHEIPPNLVQSPWKTEPTNCNWNRRQLAKKWRHDEGNSNSGAGGEQQQRRQEETALASATLQQ